MKTVAECMKKEIEMIKAEIEKGKYRYYGLRKDNNYEEGQVSRVWDGETGDPTEETLEGLSTIWVTLDTIEIGIALITDYIGSHIYLLASDDAEDGEDRREAILINHVLIATIK
jgi:hypothetical protein